MPRYQTLGGRPRVAKERRFTEALMHELDLERERRLMDQQSFAEFLGVSSSLLSLYRSGERIPSITGLFRLERAVPDLFVRTAKTYDKLTRQAEREAELQEEEDNDLIDDDGDLREASGAV